MSLITEGTKISTEEFTFLTKLTPDLEKYGDWGSWEQTFVNNLARNLGAYKERLILTPKQWEVIGRLESKCYR